MLESWRSIRAVMAAMAAAWILAACATLPPPSAAQHAAQHDYEGRFALAVTGARRQTAWTGRFSLLVGAQDLTLDLLSPLGVTLARIETGSDGARLLVPDGGRVRIERGADAQSLSRRVLGWSLPVAGLPAWVRGRPAAGRPFRPLAANGSTRRFEQDGWVVTVDFGTRRRLRMNRPAQDGMPQVNLRVILDQTLDQTGS